MDNTELNKAQKIGLKIVQNFELKPTKTTKHFPIHYQEFKTVWGLKNIQGIGLNIYSIVVNESGEMPEMN